MRGHARGKDSEARRKQQNRTKVELVTVLVGQLARLTVPEVGPDIPSTINPIEGTHGAARQGTSGHPAQTSSMTASHDEAVRDSDEPAEEMCLSR